MTAWLNGTRWWLVAVFAAAYVGSLMGEYILMHSGWGERASTDECWSGEWLVKSDVSLMVAGLLFSVLGAATVSAVWRRQLIGWRIGATLGIALAALVVWWSFWWGWSFDPACGVD